MNIVPMAIAAKAASIKLAAAKGELKNHALAQIADALQARSAEIISANQDDLATARALQAELDDIKIALIGDPTKGGRNVFTPPSISERVNRIVGGLWTTTQGPTQTQRDTYAWAGEAFTTELGRLTALVTDLETFETELELAGAPWTPGRVPTWQSE